MKICYLNPQYPDLSIENQPLLGTNIELVACSVRDEDEVIDAAKGADAILTVDTTISSRVAGTRALSSHRPARRGIRRH